MGDFYNLLFRQECIFGCKESKTLKSLRLFTTPPHIFLPLHPIPLIMKLLPTLLVATLLIPALVFAQKEKPAYKSVADSFEYYYNQGQYENIFALFSPEMAAALPKDKTLEFLGGLKLQVGEISGRSFARYEQTYACYKTQFERGLLALNISVDQRNRINGLFIKPFKENILPKMERNNTPMSLPFTGEWTVIWGGDTKEQNYHVESEAQKNAFDIVITDEKGRSYRTDGAKNEDYYAFGQPLLAPCDAEVVLTVDGIKDNIPGTLNPIYIPGNTVVLKTARNEYILLAHFKQFSIEVKQGQKVSKGQRLGLCGNSGNSSEPHLHFHIQNVEDMTLATGVKCFFDTLLVNGQNKKDYSPVKNEKIRPVQ